MQPVCKSLTLLVRLIDEPNGTACEKILSENWDRFREAQGSTHNHQNWKGGYFDHVREVMNIAAILYPQLDAVRPLTFSLSDALLVLFIHDLEKPWKYEMGPDGHLRHTIAMQTKADHQRFRIELAKNFGVILTSEHENGIKYAEGELDDYSSKKRVMSPLAAFAHMCDVCSARIWFDHPKAESDPWQNGFPAYRINP